MADDALAKWSARFGDSRHLQLMRNDPEPFPSKIQIGRGGFGHVYEVNLGGTLLALKTTGTRKITDDTLREIDILHHISRDRHQHVIAYIGSYLYVERRGKYHDLGLIMWPVAQCDLEEFMSSLAVLSQYDELYPLPSHNNDEGLSSAIYTASAIISTEGVSSVRQLHYQGILRLLGCFGCIAGAISWLHNEARVRHRDLKPSQILLSYDGLWITDFGVSTLIPDLDNTSTSGVDRMTKRYRAPERAQGLRRGRAEDVFALGCIYLEMSYVAVGGSVNDIYIPERQTGSWSYEQNVVDHFDTWILHLYSRNDPVLNNRLSSLLKLMLASQPASRPKMAHVLNELASWPVEAANVFSGCCANVVNTLRNESTSRNLASSSSRPAVDSLPQITANKNAQDNRANQNQAPSRTQQLSQDLSPSWLSLGRNKKHTYVWQCCYCGQSSIPYRSAGCPSCGYPRCGNCSITKVAVR